MNKNDRQAASSGRTTPQSGQNSKSAKPATAGGASKPATQNGEQSSRSNSEKNPAASPTSRQAASSQGNPKTKTSRTQQQKKPVSNNANPGTNSPTRQASPNRSDAKSKTSRTQQQNKQATGGTNAKRDGNSTTVRREKANPPIPNKNGAKTNTNKAASTKQGSTGGIRAIAGSRDTKKTGKSNKVARKYAARDGQSTSSFDQDNTKSGRLSKWRLLFSVLSTARSEPLFAVNALVNILMILIAVSLFIMQPPCAAGETLNSDFYDCSRIAVRWLTQFCRFQFSVCDRNRLPRADAGAI